MPARNANRGSSASSDAGLQCLLRGTRGWFCFKRSYIFHLCHISPLAKFDRRLKHTGCSLTSSSIANVIAFSAHIIRVSVKSPFRGKDVTKYSALC